MRWSGPLFVLLLAATGPLLVPSSVRATGLLPDFAVLAVVFLGFRATPERAALFGAAVGALAGLWSVEPLLFRPFVLGTVGFLAGQAATIFDREEPAVRVAAAAGGVILLRIAEEIAAALAGGGATTWTAGDAGRVAGATLAAALVAAVVAQPWFGLVRKTRLLAPMERSFRDV
jgi:cell shape-determining protein MreD